MNGEPVKWYSTNFTEVSWDALIKVVEAPEGTYGASTDRAKEEAFVKTINERRSKAASKALTTCGFCGGPRPCLRDD